MKWITLLLQLLSLRNSLGESRGMVHNARAAAERGKRAALFGVACMGGGIFGFAGVLVGVIELGLQVDRGEFLRFSGLLGSATALILLCFFIIAVAALAIGGPKEEPPPPEPPRGDLSAVIEQILVSFLQRLLKPERREGER